MNFIRAYMNIFSLLDTRHEEVLLQFFHRPSIQGKLATVRQSYRFGHFHAMITLRTINLEDDAYALLFFTH